MKNHLHKTAAPLIALLFLPFSTGAAAIDRIEILSSNDTEFHFKLKTDATLAHLEFESVADGGNLAYRSVLVSIPEGSTARLLSAVGSPLVPIVRRRGQLAAERIESSPLVEMSRPFEVRNRRMVNVRINPVVGDAVHEVVEVRIGFEGRGSTRPAVRMEDDPIFDRLFGASIANFQQAKEWALTPRRAELTFREPENDLLNATAWYKVMVSASGLYKITGQQLAQAGVSLAVLDPDSIRLFNGGGIRLNEDNSQLRPTFEEVALYVQSGGDGRFDASDYLLFFGESVNRWIYEADSQPRYESNPYSSRNIYWLAVAGSFTGAAERMIEISATPDGTEDTLFTSFSRQARAEQDNMFSLGGIPPHIFDYFTWFWSDQTNMTIFLPAPGAITGAASSLYLTANTNTGTGGASYMEVSVNGAVATDKDCNTRRCFFNSSQFVDGLNRLDLSLGPISTDIPPYLNFVEVTYQSRLRPTDGKLDFSLGSFSGRALVELDDTFSSDPILLDMAEPRKPRFMTGYDRAGGFLSFGADLTVAGPNRFYCVQPELALTPESITEEIIHDQRDVSQQADLIVVTTEAFAPYLQEYVSYRNGQGISSRIALVSDIMDNFGYGLFDPTAIRDFLKFAYENYPAPAPAAVLFVGDGSYDYLGHYGRVGINHVPPYVRRIDSAYSDDAYVHFGKEGILDSDSSYINLPD